MGNEIHLMPIKYKIFLGIILKKLKQELVFNKK